LTVEVVFVLLSPDCLSDLILLGELSPSHVFESPDGSSILPAASSLLAILQSDVLAKKVPAPPKKGGDDDFGTGISDGSDLEGRVVKLDKQLATLASQMQVLLSRSEPQGHQSTLPVPETSASAQLPEKRTPSLQSQLESLGLTPDQMKSVKHLLVPPARVLPERRRPQATSILSESEEEEAPDPDVASTPVDKAVVLMARLLKKQSATKSADPLKAAYGSLLPAQLGGELTSSAPALRGAQGYLTLRSLVKSHPTRVTQMLHKNMKFRNVGSAESFNPDCPPNAKFYVEHRSVISGHIANATWAWQAATIADLLSADPPLIEEAKARALLAVAAAEQVSLDQGSWLYATDLLMLESDPPFQSLESHSPGLSRCPHSQLVDPQWFETVAARIRSLEDSQDRKSKHLKSSSANLSAQPRRPPVAKGKARPVTPPENP